MSDHASGGQPTTQHQLVASNAPPSSTGSAALTALPHVPSSVLKKEGWRSFMSVVKNHCGVVITHRNLPEAVVMSLDNYLALAAMAHCARERNARSLADLRSHFDQRLASLSAPQAHQAVRNFMDEPVALQGKVLTRAPAAKW
jgi:PHD/YefM family antitoxin component YafN of YafNO toxin-antitoxin module